MGTPATLRINIVGDPRSATTAIDATDRSLNRLSNGLRAASAAAGVFALGAVIGQLKALTSAASDMGETVSKVGVIFGDQAAEIKAFAKTAATSIGQSEQAALDGAATFAVFGKAAGLTGKDLTGFSVGLTTLASDLASFHNTSPEDAIQALGAGLRGEAEPLRRYGILLDDATLRQEALRIGLIKTTSQALTPQQKTLAAQAAILKQVGDATGDFARTADSAANRQRALTARWENAKVTLGTALLPLLDRLLTVADKLLPFIEKNAQVIAPLVIALTVWTAAQWALNTAIGVFTAEIALPVLAVAALIAIFVIAYNKIDAFKNLVDTGMKISRAAFTSFADAVKQGWAKIQPDLDALKVKLDAAFAKLQPLLEKLEPWLKKIAEYLGNQFVFGLKIAIEVFGFLIDQFTTTITLIEKLVNWLGKIKWPTPPKWLTGLTGNLLSSNENPATRLALASASASARGPALLGAGPRLTAALLSAVATLNAAPIVRVYIGDTELRGIIRTEVSVEQDTLARRITAVRG